MCVFYFVALVLRCRRGNRSAGRGRHLFEVCGLRLVSKGLTRIPEAQNCANNRMAEEGHGKQTT
jgi:hypothetical protein